MKVTPERIAVTGVGIVTALGLDAETSFRRLLKGERAFSEVTLFDVSAERVRIAAEIAGLRVSDVAPRGEAQRWSRSDALALLAAREALESAGLTAARGGVGLAVGASTGGMYEAEAVLASVQKNGIDDASASRLLSFPLSATVDRIASALRIVERTATLCSACSSGANAIVLGTAWLASGRVSRVLAGGTDGLCRLTFAGFNALGATDTRPCRPFDLHRAGMSLGEGAAFLLLETESAAKLRDARILAYLSGWGVGSEAHHITHPEPDGTTAAQLLRQALARAGLEPQDIDYINAHGTGTPQNDAMEGRALYAALGERAKSVLVSSSKGQVGHTLAAAGAVEAAFTVLALARGVAPPCGGFETADPKIGLNVVSGGAGVEQPLRAALSSSFGFGGSGCVLAFQHPASPDRRPSAHQLERVVITAAEGFGPAGAVDESDSVNWLAQADLERAAAIDPFTLLELTRSRRFDRNAALVAGLSARLVERAGVLPEGTGLVTGTAFGSVDRSIKFLVRLSERGPRFVPPSEFPYLVPSAVAGNASIYVGMRGVALSVSELSTSGEAAVAIGCDLVELGALPSVIAGAAELHDDFAARLLGPLCSGTPSVPRAEGGAFVLIESTTHARARSARVLARVVRHVDHIDPKQAFALIPDPAHPPRAVVVSAHVSGEVEHALASSPWASAARNSVLPAAGGHEAAGAFAVGAAVALVARREAAEVLVVGGTPGRVHLLLLSAEEAI